MLNYPGPAVTSSNSHFENSVLELPILVVAIGNQHQGDACFSEESRGRQCAFMALTSLAYSQHAMSATHWQSETLDEILDMGDSQFLNALQRGFIPDAPTLSVEQLPTTVHFARSNQMKITTVTCPLRHKMKYLNPLWYCHMWQQKQMH